MTLLSLDLLEGSTLGTEHRGDICIRSANNDLLYRLVPKSDSEDVPFPEVLRVSLANLNSFARAHHKMLPRSSAQQALDLLDELKNSAGRIKAGFDELGHSGHPVRAELVLVNALLAKLTFITTTLGVAVE